MISTSVTAVFGLALAPCPQDGAAPQSTQPAIQNQTAPAARKQQDDVEDLLFRVESLEQELARLAATAAAPAPVSKNAFNPQITVFGNFLGRVDDDRVHLDDDPSLERIDDTMNLREVEVDLRAAIDPWADGVLILSSEAEVPGDYETGVEEGYVQLKKLPLLDSAPGGLKLKVGRFRAAFGRFNKIHLHDLPQVDYPRSLGTFLGEEGYIQNGVSGQFFLPSPGESASLEATLELLGGGDLPMGADLNAPDVSGLVHLGWFQELGEHHTFDLGTSYWTTEGERELWGGDATYKWKPHAGGDTRSFLVGGEVFAAHVDEPGLDDALGWFLWAQYQFTRSTYFGVRFDDAEELDDASLSTQTTSAFLTYYTTEFLRLRLGAAHAQSDLVEVDGRNTAFLELNFVFGSHPVEPYWVNR
jgi:hypothetical protein